MRAVLESSDTEPKRDGRGTLRSCVRRVEKKSTERSLKLKSVSFGWKKCGKVLKFESKIEEKRLHNINCYESELLSVLNLLPEVGRVKLR